MKQDGEGTTATPGDTPGLSADPTEHQGAGSTATARGHHAPGPYRGPLLSKEEQGQLWPPGDTTTTTTTPNHPPPTQHTSTVQNFGEAMSERNEALQMMRQGDR